MVRRLVKGEPIERKDQIVRRVNDAVSFDCIDSFVTSMKNKWCKETSIDYAKVKQIKTSRKSIGFLLQAFQR